MSTQYVLLEQSGFVANTTTPNYLIHKVAEDITLQTYAIRLASVMAKINPSATYMMVNVSHLAPSVDALVELSPFELSKAVDAAAAGNYVRRYNADAGSFQYLVAQARA